MCYVKTASQGHYHPPCPAFRMSLCFMLFDACYILFHHSPPLTATYSLVHTYTHVESHLHIHTYTELPLNDKHTHVLYMDLCLQVFLCLWLFLGGCLWIYVVTHLARKTKSTHHLCTRTWITSMGFVCVCVVQLRITVFTAFHRKKYPESFKSSRWV